MSADTTCKTCGQHLPRQCDRCGKTVPAGDLSRLHHRPTGRMVDWCDACYGRWLQAKEIAEYEDSGVVR